MLFISRMLILEQICQGQNSTRNKNWPRPPKLAKFGSECRVFSDLETWNCQEILILNYSLYEKLNWDFYIGLIRLRFLQTVVYGRPARVENAGICCMAPQLDKCLKFMAFQGVILNRVQSFLSHPQIELNFRHLSSCDTII